MKFRKLRNRNLPTAAFSVAERALDTSSSGTPVVRLVLMAYRSQVINLLPFTAGTHTMTTPDSSVHRHGSHRQQPGTGQSGQTLSLYRLPSRPLRSEVLTQKF